MHQVKKALVCVDLSEYSGKIVECAVDLLVGREGAELLLYSVISQRDIDRVEDVRNYFAGLGDHGVTTKGYIQKITDSRVERMNELKEKLVTPYDLKATVQVDTGYAYDSILKTAKSEEVDIIVIGNKGRDHITPTTFGSVARRVLRHSPVPVLTVRYKG